MSAYTIPCPLCNTPLRSAHPVPPGRDVCCPQCGGHFNADPGPAEAPEPLPPQPVEAPSAFSSPAFRTGLVAFGLVGLIALAAGGGIGLVVHANREAARQSAAAAAERRTAAEQLASMQKQFDKQQEELNRERKERERMIERERKAKAKEEKPAPPAAAVPAPAPPAPAPPAPAEDPEAKKRADYEARVDAGRAAMVAQRYADALREYQAAVRLMPGDAVATKGVRDAENRLGAQQEQDKRRTTVAGLLEKAKDALRAKHYDEALSAANEAVRMQPKDAEARQVQRDVAQARVAAKTQFARLMAQADEARDSGRFEEASRLYTKALEVIPDSDAAQRGKKSVEQVAQDTQASLTAYYRFMAAGALAMQNLQYPDAARAFGEALRLVPNDLAAARGWRDAMAGVNGMLAGQANYYQQLQAGYSALQLQRNVDATNAFQAAQRLVPNSTIAAAGLRQANPVRK